jgi:hypothetical protein
MKFKNLLLTFAATVVTMAAVAQTDGFSYQAVVRNAQGELISSKNVQLRLTLTAADGTLLYQETQTAKTNDYGVLSVTVGAGKAVQNTFSNVDWTKGDIAMKVEIDANGGTNYTDLGITKLQAVPYAYFAANSPGGNGVQVAGQKGQTLIYDGNAWVASDELAVKKLDVTADDNSGEALFEVKDKDGNVVFAVYPNAVRVYVDEEADGSKPVPTGFAVAGRRAAKDGSGDIFTVNAEGTKVYIDNDGGKPVPTGFAVAGRRASKDANIDYLSVNTTGTQIYFDDNETDGTKPVSTGLAVAGRRAGKDGEISDYLVVNKAGTQVYFDNDDDKDGAKPVSTGLAVAGRRAGKDGATSDYLVVNQAGTKVYFDNDNEDGAKPVSTGLAVAGRRAGKDGETSDYLVVNAASTQIYFDDEETDGAKPVSTGLAVAGRRAGKGGEAEDYLTINTDSTRFYINKPTSAKDGSGFAVSGREGSAKGSNGAGGFAVSGRDGSKGSSATDLFNIDLATDAKTLNEENRVYWYPEKNAFMAGNLKVEHADSVGTNSFNAGFQNKSIGEYSQALGYKSVAKGNYTTAIGREAKASSDNAYAFGNAAQALGASSYAIGLDALATGNSSYAFGSEGQALGYGSYAMGAGAKASGLYSYALGSIGNIPGLGEITAAEATGDYAYSIGAGTVASAENSFAIGANSLASAIQSFAIGFRDTTEGEGGSIAIGTFCKASGLCSIALGYDAKSTGIWCSTAMGWETTASGNYGALAAGWITSASGDCSFAMGRNTVASGDFSTALGNSTISADWCGTVIGSYNLEKYGLFVVGNGMTNGRSDENGQYIVDTTKSDIFVIDRYSGAKFFCNLTHTGALTHDSDLRLKKDVETINGALDKVLKLRGVTYYWKNREEMAAVRGVSANNMSYGYSDKLQTGVIAQEIEQVMPELVSTDKDGFKSVDYVGITPVLIEAIKEQQAIIDGQQKQIDELKAENLKMQQQIEQILEKLNQ